MSGVLKFKKSLISSILSMNRFLLKLKTITNFLSPQMSSSIIQLCSYKHIAIKSKPSKNNYDDNNIIVLSS